VYLQQVSSGDGDFQYLLQEYLRLFEDLVQSQTQGAKSDKASSGLLRRLFGGKDKGEESSSEETIQVAVMEANDAEGSTTAAISFSQASSASHDGLRDRIAGVLEGLLAQMQMEFPEPVGALQQRWQKEHELEVLPELIQATLNLHQSVSAHRAKDTETFLLALSQRLVDVYRFLAGQQEQQSRAHEEVGRFDANMRSEIEELRTHVVQASSLPVLKQDIELRVTGILKLVDTYREQIQVSGRSLHTEVQELEAKLKRMERESSKLREIVRSEHRRAMQDALTGIPNRQALQDRSRLEFQRWKRYATPLSIIMIDVDFFKRINDRFGHLAGDKVLKLVAQTLQSSVRQTDFLARYGGEEFMVILPQTSISEAAIAGEKLRQAIEVCPFHFSGEPIKITCSLGLAMLQGEETWEQAVDRADQALLNAKRTGRNRLCSVPEAT
ncbi:MAG: GGDEF domain-containing protein, partial [Pseudomonadales bacterium]|nr:GGDEF domain-containing protein [Pseudomonadales bacterium]